MFPAQIFMLILTGLLVLTSCHEPAGKATESAYNLDPTRTIPPFPRIAIPADADTSSPRWKGIDLTPAPPVMPQSPREQQESFVLQSGYSIEPVLTEPRIIEPAAIQFDGNGRMYVLELRTYMQDIDATDELQPISCISRWEDLDDDGIYETGGIFLDSLVFPRFVVPFGPHTILAMESNQDVIHKYTDTDNDGKADKKEFFTDGMGRTGNVEHQTSFLTWTLDNWMYSTYNPVRIRWTPDGILREPSGRPWGQWGVTQDDYGLVWMQDGAGGVPANFQFPIVYGNYQVEGQYEPGFRTPYSLIRLADFEPGMKEVKPDGSLANVTGAAGNDVFRGDRLPDELQGEYFYGEPVARIVRRVTSTKREGLTYLQNPYAIHESEFLQSTDPLFRPVDIATAPDGSMYIVDMYRGIIQQGTWTQDGSYLRTKILQYQMDDIIRYGRIWRLTYDGIERRKEKPRMFEESDDELLRHFLHPNGWWRDKAQQLLILRQARSVIPQLREMMNESENELARIHALWTLEGLNGLNQQDVIDLLGDESPQMRYQALRAGETLYKYGHFGLADYYREMIRDPKVEVVIQAMQSMYILNIPGIESMIRGLLEDQPRKGVQVVGEQILKSIEEASQNIANRFSRDEQILFLEGKEHYLNLCATCHGPQGLGSPAGENSTQMLAPAFSGSNRITGHPEYAVKVVLHGLDGPINGKDYGSLMIPMKIYDDQYIASVISYIRNDFGNQAGFITPDYVNHIRKNTAGRQTPYTFQSLWDEVPRNLSYQSGWIITASSTAWPGVGSTKDPGLAFTHRGWLTEYAQSPESWFQIQFPNGFLLAGIEFECTQDNYPKQFIIATSENGDTWEISEEKQGKVGRNSFSIDMKEPVKYLRIQTTDDADHPWGMKNLTIYSRNNLPI